MSNGDQNIYDRTINAHIHTVCAGCQQAFNTPFNYKGIEISDARLTRPSASHLIAESNGGTWAIDNVPLMHFFCNAMVQTLNITEQVYSVFWGDYGTYQAMIAKCMQAKDLKNRMYAQMKKNGQYDADVLSVLKAVAHVILTESESNKVRRLPEGTRRRTLAAVA